VTNTVRRSTLLGAVVWFGVAYGIAIVGYLVLNAAAGRLLGPDQFGYFVIALTVSTLVGQIGLLGVHRAGLREAARLEETDLEGFRELRRGVRAVSLVTLPLVSLVSGLVTYLVADAASLGARVATAVGMSALVLLGGQQKIWANYLRGFGQIRFASLLEGRSGGAMVAVLQAALVVLVWRLAPDLGLAGALGAAAVGYAIPVLLARERVVRLWRHLPVSTPLLRDVRFVFARDWRFASNQVAVYLNSTVELWLAGLVLSRFETSMFGAAQRLAMLLVIPLTSLQTVFAPVVSRLIVRDDDSRLEPLLRTGATLATLTTAVAWVPMLVAPGFLLTTVFGASFGEAAPILVLLTLGNVANVFVGLCGTVLIMSHHEGVVASVQWGGVIARVSLGVAAAFLFGTVGLGVTAAGVTVVVFGAMWLATRRIMGLSTQLTLHPNLTLIKRTSG
jgi:O-antigen/teichoic acid export membrane protein